MKVNRQTLAYAFGLLLASVSLTIAEEQKLPNVFVTNPDGSTIKASADVKIVVQLAVEEHQVETNSVVRTTFNKFITETKMRAEKGDAAAQVILGFKCFQAKDFIEAVKWFLMAADQKNANGQNNLGACYANGFGVPMDFAVAAKWYRRAADQGDANAQFSLGQLYELGKGVPKDHAEAKKLYGKAADQGDASAQKWYRKAAEEGDASAQCFLGHLYDWGLAGAKEGEHTSKSRDSVEAAKWYRRAAEQGYSNAQNNLGVKYAIGEGVSMDYVEAYKWFNLAAAQTDQFASVGATVQRDELIKKMTPDQIAEGQRLSSKFRSRKEIDSAISSSPEIASTSGSGFFISEDGFLVTNHHVVEGANQIRVVTSKGLISAKVIKVDAANDVALLKAEGKFSPLPIVASRAVRLGNSVVTVGFPNIGLQGFAPKFARGEIAALSGAGDDARYFQISVPVQPGNSGGALVDEHGNVVGVVSAKLNARAALASSGSLPENVNYAVKSSFLLSFLESVPEVSAKLKEPNTKERKFDDVVSDAEKAAVLVVVY